MDSPDNQWHSVKDKMKVILCLKTESLNKWGHDAVDLSIVTVEHSQSWNVIMMKLVAGKE